MAKTIRSPSDASQNWATRGANAQSFYVSRASQADWQGGAGSAQAEANYNTSMTAVLQKKSRQTGVQQSSNQVYSQGVTANANRYGSGITAAKPKMDAFMGKFLPQVQTIVNALPPRGVRGSPQNTQRSTQMQQSLNKLQGQFKVKNVAKATS